MRVLDNLVTGYPMYLPIQHPHLDLIVGDATDVQPARMDTPRCLNTVQTLVGVKPVVRTTHSRHIPMHFVPMPWN